MAYSRDARFMHGICREDGEAASGVAWRSIGVGESDRRHRLLIWRYHISPKILIMLRLMHVKKRRQRCRKAERWHIEASAQMNHHDRELAWLLAAPAAANLEAMAASRKCVYGDLADLDVARR